MSNELNRRLHLGQEAAVVSLVAIVACAFASDALASRSPAGPSLGEQELSARVTTIVERVRGVDPALLRDLPQEMKIAQWRNR
jgi:hypothetical protein